MVQYRNNMQKPRVQTVCHNSGTLVGTLGLTSVQLPRKRNDLARAMSFSRILEDITRAGGSVVSKLTQKYRRSSSVPIRISQPLPPIRRGDSIRVIDDLKEIQSPKVARLPRFDWQRSPGTPNARNEPYTPEPGQSEDVPSYRWFNPDAGISPEPIPRGSSVEYDRTRRGYISSKKSLKPSCENSLLTEMLAEVDQIQALYDAPLPKAQCGEDLAASFEARADRIDLAEWSRTMDAEKSGVREGIVGGTTWDEATGHYELVGKVPQSAYGSPKLYHADRFSKDDEVHLVPAPLQPRPSIKSKRKAKTTERDMVSPRGIIVLPFNLPMSNA